MTMKDTNIARKLEVEEDSTTADQVLVVGGTDDTDAAAEILTTLEEVEMIVDEPSVDDSSVEFVYEEVKESENSDGGTILPVVKEVEDVDESPTVSGEISEPLLDADELTTMAVDTPTKEKQDLFTTDHQQSVASTEEDPASPAVSKSKAEAYLVELLDFELTLLFAEPERRRYLRSLSSVRHRQARQSNLRSIMVKETLTDYLDNFYETELSKRREAGVDYSPLDEIYLNPDESKERVIVGKSAATGELYDRMYSTAYTGVAIFRQEDEAQRVPKEFSVQSMQLQALNEALNDDSELLHALQDADVGRSTGLDEVQSISARIVTSKDEEGSSTSTPETTQPGSTVNTQTQPSTGGLADTVVIAAVAVAALSLVLLGLSLFVSYRRQKNKSYKTPTASRSGKFPQTRSSGGQSNNHWKVKASPDEIPYAISGTLASSSSPTEPGENGPQGFKDEEPINVPSEVIPATLDPYPDGVSVSAVSEVSSLGQVIMEAIKAYSSETPNAGNEAESPDSQDIIIGQITQHMVDGEESVGVMSLDDSSTLGYSLAGYTIGDGTKCGY